MESQNTALQKRLEQIAADYRRLPKRSDATEELIQRFASYIRAQLPRRVLAFHGVTYAYAASLIGIRSHNPRLIAPHAAEN